MIKRFSLSRCVALSLHYLQSMKRNPARFIEIIIWPSFELLLFGMLALSIHKTANASLATAINILTGVMYWNFSARVIQESVAQFLDDAFSKNIQNLFIAPFSLIELSLSLIISSIGKLCISFIFLLSITYAFFPAFYTALTAVNGLLLLELIVFGASLSLFALSFIFIFGVRMSFIGWFISTILQVFSCVFFERDVLPGILHTMSYFVPSSYIFEAFRDVVTYPLVSQQIQPVIVGLLTLYMSLSIILLQYAFSYARRHALLTKI
ncbi:ABC transporter permease [Candidatus Woesebacteria bacterium]|nr:ABC transporter permease [Candidatus Woesebacteria bacterium]